MTVVGRCILFTPMLNFTTLFYKICLFPAVASKFFRTISASKARVSIIRLCRGFQAIKKRKLLLISVIPLMREVLGVMRGEI